jgi:pyridoxamine 5'-phosphate oxidase
MEELDNSQASADPIEQFAAWYELALASNLPEPDAMAIATAPADGRPSCRMVLLKGYDARGFTFFSSYESRKGVELAENPQAAVVLFWPELRRQIRIEGHVAKLSVEESDLYFGTRPRGSQIAALASRQSTVLPSRGALEERVSDLERELAGRDVPRPPYWGGYRLVPTAIEFWQGRPNRLHDRLQYRRQDDGTWVLERLSP